MGETPVPAQQPQAGEATRLSSPDVDAGGKSHPVGPAAEGPATAVGLSASEGDGGPAGEHEIAPVTDRSTFARLSTGGRRVRRHPVTVAWVPDEGSHEGQNRARVSYAITRKVGTAVVRNRVRRRLRAVNRELAARMRPGSYLMTARSEAASMPYDQLRASVGEALDALAADGEEAGARSSR